MNDTNIVCFLSVAKNKNISLTARQLAITQQAVSRNIQRLEEELGFPLLNRNSNNIVLTYAGEEFFKLFDQYDKNLMNMGYVSPWFDHGINVGWSESSEKSDHIRQSLKYLKEMEPDLQIHYLYSSDYDLARMFNENLLDLLILPSRSIGLIKVPFLSSFLEKLDLYIVSSRESALARDDFELSMLSDYPVIFVNPEMEADSDSVIQIRLLFTSLGIRHSPVLCVRDTSSMFAEIANNSGYAICTLSSISDQNDFFHTRKINGFQETIVTAKRLDNNNPWAEKLNHIFQGGKFIHE